MVFEYRYYTTIPRTNQIGGSGDSFIGNNIAVDPETCFLRESPRLLHHRIANPMRRMKVGELIK